MKDSTVILVAGDGLVADRVERRLGEGAFRVRRVDPGVDPLDDEAMYDMAFESRAVGVVLIEQLGRGDCEAPAPRAELLQAAKAASKAPDAKFFGWVTARALDDEAVAELRRSGMPYGILRTGPVFDLVTTDADPGGTVLVERELANALAKAGAISVDTLAREVVTWIEDEIMREGRTAEMKPRPRPLEEQLSALSLKYLALPSWRTGLNSFFGMPVVERCGTTDGRLVIARRLLRPRGGSTARGVAKTRTGSPRNANRGNDTVLTCLLP